MKYNLDAASCINMRIPMQEAKHDLLSSQSLEEGDDFLESLEFIASKLDAGSHETFRWVWGDEVVAIEQVLLVGEDDMVVGWGREVFFYPSLYLRHILMVVGRG